MKHQVNIYSLILQLQLGQDEEMKDKVQIVAILSMSDQEIDETLEIVRYILFKDYFSTNKWLLYKKTNIHRVNL